MKAAFNHKIEDKYLIEFERVADGLPGHKYEVIETALRVFCSMPEALQRELLFAHKQHHEEAFRLYGLLVGQLEQPATAAKRKSSKSA